MAMTFNWTCWIFSLLVMFNISIIDGQQCQYPADWQGPQVHWFTKYSTAGTMVGTRFRLDTEEDVVFSSANDVTVTGDWDCLRGGQDESSYRYYLRRNGSETQCVRLYKEGKGLLLVRTTFTAIESTPLSTCIQIFGTLNTPLPLDVLVRNPGVFDFTNNNCQLPAGLYQTQLSTVSGENACAGNKQSTALITRDTILFKLCINEDSYLSPYRSELQCVATMEEISIGDSPTSSHGGVVILAHTDKTTGRVSFYCGRYLKTGNNFLMSLVTSKDGSVHCKPTVNYVYVAPGIDTQAKAYMMSALSCSPGVCENGATCIAESPQLIRCACLPGYTGFFCEKVNLGFISTGNDDKEPETCADCVHSYMCHKFHSNVVVCYCRFGYTGLRCQYQKLCSTALCQNGATCVEATTSTNFSCLCAAGFTGALCTDKINNCPTNACNGNGLCTEGINSYSCICYSGFSGSDCGINIDDCPSLNTCNDRGRCFDEVNNYTCVCNSGFEGQDCEINIDDCNVVNVCHGHGVCVDNVNGYVCECYKGFAGEDCQIDLDDCHTSLCSGHGVCMVKDSAISCVCYERFTGRFCELPINNCPVENPCNLRGICVDGQNDYHCVCVSGYTGKDCEAIVVDCPVSACSVNGYCVHVDGMNDYSCICNQGFTGQNCEVNVSVCPADACNNNGFCLEGLDAYTCTCHRGFTGEKCQTNINDCTEDACNDRGTCVDRVDDYECLCHIGFFGKDCETNYDDCTEDACSHHGKCVDMINDYQCVCDAGFSGNECQYLIDLCESSLCIHGWCENLATPRAYICHCDQGYTGLLCNEKNDTIEDHCSIKPCLNGGTCSQDNTGYSCTCPPTHTGELCETDPCTGHICLHGTCIGDLSSNSYTCSCKPGYTGTFCHILLSCYSQPCLHNATCEELPTSGHYQCHCPAPYYGQHCEHVSLCHLNPCGAGNLCSEDASIERGYHCRCHPHLDNAYCDSVVTCEDAPCHNGATCYAHGVAYVCGCPYGFAGWQCDEALRCYSNPCQNGGRCSEVDNICSCPPGYTGKYCETALVCQRSFPCQFGGTCKDLPGGSYICLCRHGFTGINCDQALSCMSSPCQNDGLCSEGATSFLCSCQPGYTGEMCETALACFSAPCQNGAKCTEAGGSTFVCDCPEGFTGLICENAIGTIPPSPATTSRFTLPTTTRISQRTITPFPTGRSLATTTMPTRLPVQNQTIIQLLTTTRPSRPPTEPIITDNTGATDTGLYPCQSSPCKNGGRCFNDLTNYYCECAGNYSGINCEREAANALNTCANNQCASGATCFSRPDGYICQCPPGFLQPFCDKYVCDGHTCMNGGTCVPDPEDDTDYNCLCTDDWAGKMCQYVAGCKSSPCYNGATCQSLPQDSMYECRCGPDYDGDQCENPRDDAGFDFSVLIIVISVLVAIVVLVIFVLVCICCIVRKKGDDKLITTATKPPPPSSTKQVFVTEPKVSVISLPQPAKSVSPPAIAQQQVVQQVPQQVPPQLISTRAMFISDDPQRVYQVRDPMQYEYPAVDYNPVYSQVSRPVVRNNNSEVLVASLEPPTYQQSIPATIYDSDPRRRSLAASIHDDEDPSEYYGN